MQNLLVSGPAGAFLMHLPTAAIADVGESSASPAPDRPVRRDHRLRRFDPQRAHGAWILLCASVGAGALVGAKYNLERALLAGTAVAGGYLLACAVYVGIRRRGRQALVGAVLATLLPVVALWWNPSPAFMVPMAVAAVLAIMALAVARARGFLSPATIVLGTAALVLAAPVASSGGGASAAHSAMLFGLLWPFCCWRTFCVGSGLKALEPWDRRELRARGLREAALTGAWALVVSVGLRMV